MFVWISGAYELISRNNNRDNHNEISSNNEKELKYKDLKLEMQYLKQWFETYEKYSWFMGNPLYILTSFFPAQLSKWGDRICIINTLRWPSSNLFRQLDLDQLNLK